MGQVVRRYLTRSVLPGGARCFVGVDGMIRPAHCPSFVDRSRAKIRLLSFRSARQAADGKGQNRSFNVTAGFVRFHGNSGHRICRRRVRSYDSAMVSDLLSGLASGQTNPDTLADGATLLRGFAVEQASNLVAALGPITEVAPFRHMVTPGGYTMSVAMTNCGQTGWVTNRSGYRYDPPAPETGKDWPEMPAVFAALAAHAAAAAGYLDFVPDSCLVNRYAPGARMSLHQDKDERDFTAPIVSFSLGLPAVFLFGGLRRSDRAQRIHLVSGDVVVWGGPARMTYHGVAPLADGYDPLTGNCRINFTLRKAL